MTAAVVHLHEDPHLRNRQLAAAKSFDIAELDEDAWQRSLVKVQLRQRRAHELLKTALIKDVHYGRSDGAFAKDRLNAAGGEDLRAMFGLTIRRSEKDDEVISGEDFVSVTVHRVICDRLGNPLAEESAVCSSKEKRFRKRSGDATTFIDAREVLNDCFAMALIRCANRLTLSVTGLRGFLANADEAEEGVKERDEKALVPWTIEEKQAVYAAAAAKKLTKEAFERLTEDTLGRKSIGTGEDVRTLMTAIESYEPPARAKRAKSDAATDSVDASGTSSDQDPLAALDDVS